MASSTIHSDINPEVVFTGNVSFDPQDYHRQLTQYKNYEIVAPDTGQSFEFDVLVGHPNIRQQICFYYLYTAVSKHRLGLFEFPVETLSQYIDEEGDLIPPSKPRLFSFVDEAFLQNEWEIQDEKQREQALKQKLRQKPRIQIKKGGKDDENEEEEEEDKDEEEERDKDKDENEEENGLVWNKRKIVPKHMEQSLYDSMETKKSSLPNETEKEAKSHIREYKDFRKTRHVYTHWLNERMKNLHYTVDSTDSILNILQKVLERIGKITSPERCRYFLSQHESIHSHYKSNSLIYSELEYVYFEQENRLDTIRHRLDDISKIMSKMKKEESNELDKERIRLQIDEKNTQSDMKNIQEDIHNLFPHMKSITTLEQYREYIQSPRFYNLPIWALSILQEEFQIQFIFIPKETKERPFVLPLAKPTVPEYYILLSLEEKLETTLDQIFLVHYKTEFVFSFEELPFSIKCLASQNIESTFFRFLTDFAIFSDISLPKIEPPKREEKEVMFQIDFKTLPIIPWKKWVTFRHLRRIPDWHLELSDDCPIKNGLLLDEHVWPTVTHYVLAGNFMKDSVYYLEYTTDVGESMISKTAEVAKTATEHPGVYRMKRRKTKSQCSLSNIEYIPDYGIKKLKNVDFEKRRMHALKVKFSHSYYKNILSCTLNAALKNEKGELDHLLMQMRIE